MADKKLRNLKTSDLFILSRILRKMNIKDEIKKLVKDITGTTPERKKKAEHDMEIDLVMLFVENISNAEQEIYKFMGDLSGKKLQEIADQPPAETINMLKELFEQANFTDFLSLASK